MPQLSLYAYPAMAIPGFDAFMALIETNRFRRLVTESAHRDRTQMALVQGALDMAELQMLFQQVPKRPIIEQGGWHAKANPEQIGTGPAQRLGNHPRPVGAIYLTAAKVCPNMVQTVDTVAKIAGIARQRQRIDCPGRRAADHREGIDRLVRQQLGYRLQDPDLISGTRTAASQHQGGDTRYTRGNGRLSTHARLRRLRLRRLA